MRTQGVAAVRTLCCSKVTTMQCKFLMMALAALWTVQLTSASVQGAGPRYSTAVNLDGHYHSGLNTDPSRTGYGPWYQGHARPARLAIAHRIRGVPYPGYYINYGARHYWEPPTR
jgi:hypothetical protein